MPSSNFAGDMLDTFDHVVVLMLENRSFDNLLGYMYPNGVPANAPLGKTFEGVMGNNLSNPVPPGVKYPPPHGVTTIPVSPVEAGNYFQPYPDPGDIDVTLEYRDTIESFEAKRRAAMPWLPTAQRE